MKNPTYVQIDLNAARNYAAENADASLKETLDMQSFNGHNQMSVYELVCHTHIKAVLSLVRFALVPNPAAYCRSVAVVMALRALEDNHDHITRYEDYVKILSSLHHYTDGTLKEYFKTFKSWALAENEWDKTGLLESIDGCAATLMCEVIAGLEYQYIDDLDECALEAPLKAFMNWVELSAQCDPSLKALNAICEAAQRAEYTWRSGTGLHFDFMTDPILAAYPAAYSATHGLTNDCTEHTAEEVLLSVSQQG
ncbi:hypothetical protein OYT1_ch1632 [Ferriphaselus amnicola]|uniref:Uncharacterized protein n=1 Tax=Ferriphaselus amnicola TaxID=1188319 RepID=A0A2Z6GCY7_9PROT|nr:hypothetical protein [Ferriphaselus amnicola]BBE51179.1 hypothetical protein OYT1_ch1632 [Ferriphaselus amnicola]